MRAPPDSLPALIRPPLWGLFLFICGVAAGIWGTILVGTICFALGKGKADTVQAYADSIISTMQTGVIIRGPDGRPLWIAPPRDTTKRR